MMKKIVIVLLAVLTISCSKDGDMDNNETVINDNYYGSTY